MKCRTLMVEDDPHILDVVEFLLQEEGHLVDRATEGHMGWNLFQQHSYGLVILDLGLPGIPGLKLFEKIRAEKQDQAIIMLTAMGEEEHRVKGLTLGADDYIPKPFSNEEFVARVRNILRRCPPPPSFLKLGEIRLYPEEGHVTLCHQPIDLPSHEFRLLKTLMRHRSKTFTRDQLLDAMYGSESEFGDRAVDQAVTRLRRKFRNTLPSGSIIQSIYGLGYRLGQEETSA